MKKFKLIIAGIFIAFLLINQASALTQEQINTINNLADATNTNNETLISLFENTRSYTRSEMDIWLNLTREIINIRLENVIEKMNEVQNITDIVRAETKSHLDNYTAFIEGKTMWLETLAEMTDAIAALTEEITIEGSSEEIYSLIEELQTVIGGMPNKYMTKMDLEAAMGNTSASEPYTPVAPPDNTIIYAFVIIVIFCVSMWAFSKKGEIKAGDYKALFSGLKKGDEKKSMQQLEMERKIREEMNARSKTKKKKKKGSK